jgi:alpha-N-arabinofuranosidase
VGGKYPSPPPAISPLSNKTTPLPQPDLISFTADPADTTSSVSYSVLHLLANTRIRETLPTTILDDGPIGPAYWVAGRGDDNSYVVKAAVYNSTDGADVPFKVSFEGLGGKHKRSGDKHDEGLARATLTILSAEGPWAHNAPGKKEVVKTTVKHIKADRDGMFGFHLPDLSVALLVAEGD